MPITAELDPATWSKVDATLRDLAVNFAPQAGARSLNRAAIAGRVVAVRDVAYALGTKQAAVKGYIRINNATPEHLESRIYALGKQGIPLIKLDASGPEPSRGMGAGVRVSATPGSFPHAFIATMPRSGKRGVFERTPGATGYRGKPPHRSQLPIHQLFTRPIPHVLRQVRQGAMARAAEALRTNLVSELRYALKS